jgi:hypothetical protein
MHSTYICNVLAGNILIIIKSILKLQELPLHNMFQLLDLLKVFHTPQSSFSLLNVIQIFDQQYNTHVRVHMHACTHTHKHTPDCTQTKRAHLTLLCVLTVTNVLEQLSDYQLLWKNPARQTETAKWIVRAKKHLNGAEKCPRNHNCYIKFIIYVQ